MSSETLDAYVQDKPQKEEKENPFKQLAQLKQQKLQKEQEERDKMLSGKGPDGLVRHDAAMILSKEVNETQIKALSEDLKGILIYHRIKKEESGNTVIFMGCNNEDIMLQEAERLALLKEKKRKTPELQEIRNKERAEEATYVHARIIKAEKKKPFKKAKQVQYEGGTFNTILNEADKSRIFFSLINNFKMNELKNISRAFDEKKYPRDQNETFIFFLKRYNLLVELTPLHSKSRAIQDKKLIKEALKDWFIPTDLVREYYGENVAIYFQWMNHFIKWLSVPGGLAFLFGIINSRYYTLHDSPLNSVYSIIVAIWSTLFVIYWKRQSKRLFIEWDAYNVNSEEGDDVRKEFKGIDRKNPITDRLEPTFTSQERMIRYLQSAAYCAPYFIGIIFCNICFLNLGAIIDPKKHNALFQMNFLSDLCQPGNFLDPTGPFFKFVTPTQIFISIQMNGAFKKMAYWTTENENHRTQTDFDNSLIIKRFFFMFCDYFLYLLYVGLYLLRIDQLRSYLTFLFTIDEVRRLLTEAIIPYVTMWRAKRAKKANAGQDKNHKKTQNYVDEKENEEIEKADYETFDDFFEMIITFGYITLFASAFPLASFISIIFIYFESRSDLFKLEKLMKRPHVKKVFDIGSWKYVLEFMAFISIFTNIILFTYASDQIEHLLPFMGAYKNDSVYNILTIFGLEHLMLALVVVLRILLDSDLGWVNIFFARKRYQREQKALQKARVSMIGAGLLQGFIRRQTSMMSDESSK